MKILRRQNFDLDFYEIESGMDILRIGVAAYKKHQPGPVMFYPESGSEYLMVVFDKGWYKFEFAEFGHEAGLGYIAEKLNCSIGDAKIIREFIHDLLYQDKAKNLLVDNGKEERFYVENPNMF